MMVTGMAIPMHGHHGTHYDRGKGRIRLGGADPSTLSIDRGASAVNPLELAHHHKCHGKKRKEKKVEMEREERMKERGEE